MSDTRADGGVKTGILGTEAPERNTRCLSVVELFEFQNSVFFIHISLVVEPFLLYSGQVSKKSTTAS